LLAKQHIQHSAELTAKIEWYTPQRKIKSLLPLISLAIAVNAVKVVSEEAQVQAERERTELAAIYMNPAHIPFSPAEPPSEDAAGNNEHAVFIPLEDASKPQPIIPVRLKTLLSLN
jgi:hypothetical protein